MTTDTVTVNESEKPEALQEQVEQNLPEVEEVKEEKELTVPLSALQKERKKRQDAEQENRMFREHQLKQMQQAEKPPEDDDSQYEPVTKADLAKEKKAQEAQYAHMLRDVEERNWSKQNPDRAEFVNEKLTEFLKKRPNLTRAIEDSSNRYEEAWELMQALTPKQRTELNKAAPKKEAPGSPTAVPKAASMNQSLDIMSMSDKEFGEWRKSQRKK